MAVLKEVFGSIKSIIKNEKTEKLIKLKNLKLTNIRDTLKEIDGPPPGG